MLGEDESGRQGSGMIMSGLLAIRNGQSMWPVYALAAITILYVVFRPMLRKKRGDPLEKMPSMGLSSQRAVEREMNNLLVELSEMARQVTAQLDTRTAKLEALIEEADRKIAELRRVSGGAIAAEAEQEGAGERGEERAGAAEDRRHADVYSLADRGRTSAEIAEELGRQRGEVELILALRSK